MQPQRRAARVHALFASRRLAAKAAIGAVTVLVALPICVRTYSSNCRTPLVQLSSAESRESGSIAAVIGEMAELLDPLEKQVSNGQIVAKFGEKAQGILATVVSRSGDLGPKIERTVDGMLEGLFMQQLVLLRQQIMSKSEKGSAPANVVSQVDRQFVQQAKELKRPGSDWSFEPERYALRAALEGSYRRDSALADERQRATKAQQSAVEIISRLQSQMEVLQQKVQSMRSGSPWFLSSSYRIPGTPLTLIGRYQQGRANLELSLSDDPDPINAAAGFVKGVGPPNLGVTMNLGM